MPEGASVPDEPAQLSDVLAAEYADLGRTLGNGAVAAGDEPSRLRALFRAVHALDLPFSALSISGGGIRSATFALGAVQALARRGLLAQFDYLSTVSGGGYTGSWLSAWIHRAGSAEEVSRLLAADAPPDTGPDPVGHLRAFNNYLTPRLGAASADTWTLAAIIVRNVLLNWLVLIPLLMAVLAGPRLLVSVLQMVPSDAAPRLPALIALQPWLLGTALFLFGVASYHVLRYLPSIGTGPLPEGAFARLALAPLVASAFFLVVDFWWRWDDRDQKPTLLAFVILSVALTTLAWLASLVPGRATRAPGEKRHVGAGAVTAVVLGVCSGAAAWLLTRVLFHSGSNHDDPSFYAAFAPPLLLGGVVLGWALAVGLTSHTLGDPDREWLARAGAYVLLALAGWVLLCVVVLVVPHFLFRQGGFNHVHVSILGALSGIATAFTRGQSPSVQNASSTASAPSGIASLVRAAALPVFVVCLMMVLSMVTNVIVWAAGAVPGVSWNDHHHLVEGTPLYAVMALTAGLLALSLGMGRFVNVNTFSLHAMYRNRLVRAYLGASNACRRPDPFTGMCATDDLPVARLRGQRPLHVVNMALNLVAGRRLAWQQRKAESFTVSAHHAGSSGLGFRDTSAYGGKGGLSLGTAVAISGAAASPNMGYHSSALVGFTMMLFNARLGWWLGNPGKPGRRTWRLDGPRSPLSSVVREMLGLTDDTSPFVYLSDGGHFENLALYEMVQRRCRTIVVLDGGCDPGFTYEDLGNALRKIRIDFGIPVEFEEADIPLLRERKRRCAVAVIRYSAVDEGAVDGRLVYVKPVMLGNEPPDMQSYAAAFPDFPHQSTSNQWFDESQTESYRMLGDHTVSELCRGYSGTTLSGLAQYLGEKGAGPRETESSRRPVPGTEGSGG